MKATLKGLYADSDNPIIVSIDDPNLSEDDEREFRRVIDSLVAAMYSSVYYVVVSIPMLSGRVKTFVSFTDQLDVDIDVLPRLMKLVE